MHGAYATRTPAFVRATYKFRTCINDYIIIMFNKPIGYFYANIIPVKCSGVEKDCDALRWSSFCYRD